MCAKVEALRNRLGLRQVDVSKECGVNASMLSQWMLGRYKGNVGRVGCVHLRGLLLGLPGAVVDRLLRYAVRLDQRLDGVVADPPARREAHGQEHVYERFVWTTWIVGSGAHQSNAWGALNAAVMSSTATSPKLKRKLDDPNDANQAAKR